MNKYVPQPPPTVLIAAILSHVSDTATLFD